MKKDIKECQIDNLLIICWLGIKKQDCQ